MRAAMTNMSFVARSMNMEARCSERSWSSNTSGAERLADPCLTMGKQRLHAVVDAVAQGGGFHQDFVFCAGQDIQRAAGPAVHAVVDAGAVDDLFVFAQEGHARQVG